MYVQRYTFISYSSIITILPTKRKHNRYIHMLPPPLHFIDCQQQQLERGKQQEWQH